MAGIQDKQTRRSPCDSIIGTPTSLPESHTLRKVHYNPHIEPLNFLDPNGEECVKGGGIVDHCGC